MTTALEWQTTERPEPVTVTRELFVREPRELGRHYRAATPADLRALLSSLDRSTALACMPVDVVQALDAVDRLRERIGDLEVELMNERVGKSQYASRAERVAEAVLAFARAAAALCNRHGWTPNGDEWRAVEALLSADVRASSKPGPRVLRDGEGGVGEPSSPAPAEPVDDMDRNPPTSLYDFALRGGELGTPQAQRIIDAHDYGASAAGEKPGALRDALKEYAASCVFYSEANRPGCGTRGSRAEATRAHDYYTERLVDAARNAAQAIADLTRERDEALARMRDAEKGWHALGGQLSSAIQERDAALAELAAVRAPVAKMVEAVQWGVWRGNESRFVSEDSEGDARKAVSLGRGK